MLDELKKETNFTRTENDALTHKTTTNSNLDFFALGGALRKRTEEDIQLIFSNAFTTDDKLALKTLFYLRDILEGQGERRTFRVIIKYLGNEYSERIKKLIKYVPEFGRWDDLMYLLDTKVEKDVIVFIKEQYEKDLKEKVPSLLGKWLPSENASSYKTKVLAKKVRKALSITSKEYRKSLVILRDKIKIVEKLISEKKWGEIDYGHLPSKAGLKYRSAFSKHDAERYSEYLDDVKAGKKTINASALYPYEIVGKVLDGQSDETLNILWSNLPNYVKEDENAIVVADVSGSMIGLPMNISVSLALYYAERNKGKFANHFITFSNNPVLVEIKGKDVCEKISNISRADWDMNTNIEAVFDLILHTAIKYKLPQKEIPKKIYIISDMEFDRCTEEPNATVFSELKRKFKEKDYKLPELVFWNVDARQNQFPVTSEDNNVQLVSGASPILFKQIVSGKSAYDLMVEILSSERYKDIE